MDSILSDNYPVHFAPKAYGALNEQLAKANYSVVFVLVDENTHEACLPKFLSELEGDYPLEILEVSPGEAHKTIETCTGLWQALSELGADRKSVLINLGGGVMTDMGGFVAATFKRGIDFINVPTTLLAMVDASVGGKTGVDLDGLKNQVGVITPPVMVLIDTAYLSTLAPEQRTSGFAEMLKHGLIQNASYWERLLNLTDHGLLAEHIHTSVSIKNKVVMEDPREQGLRKILNYGHTLGHAIESYFLEHPDKQTLLHGEAIAIGMVMEAFISNRLTHLPKAAMEAIKNGFATYFKAVAIQEEDIPKILDYLKYDKKNSHGNINFVLLEDLGVPVIDVKVPKELLIEAFAYYKE